MKKIFFIGIMFFVSLFFGIQSVGAAGDGCWCNVEIETPWCELKLIDKQITSNTTIEQLLNDTTISVKGSGSGQGQCLNSGKNSYEAGIELKLAFLNKKKSINGTDLILNQDYEIDFGNLETCNFLVENGGAEPFKISCKYVVPGTTPPPPIDCKTIYKDKESQCKADAQCLWATSKCFNKNAEDICQFLATEDLCKEATECVFSSDVGKCLSKKDDATNIYLKDKYKAPEDYSGPLKDTPCAWSGSCRNVDDLLSVFIKIGEMIFGLVAGIAFVFFIYGGFTMMLSFGNAEKVKKGQQILVAAVVGLVIVFSAYLLVDFLLDALGVVGSFRGVDLK